MPSIHPSSSATILPSPPSAPYGYETDWRTKPALDRIRALRKRPEAPPNRPNLLDRLEQNRNAKVIPFRKRGKR